MSLPARVGRAWRALHPEQRLAAIAALAVLLSMFLPWYEVTTSFADGSGRPASGSVTRSAFGVSPSSRRRSSWSPWRPGAAVRPRREQRFHLPGGDGTVILAAGLWVVFLIFFRQIDKPDIEQSGAVAGHGGRRRGASSSRSCAARCWPTRAADPRGARGRAAAARRRPDAGASRRVARRAAHAAGPAAASRPRASRAQLSFDEPPPVDDPARAQTRRRAATGASAGR